MKNCDRTHGVIFDLDGVLADSEGEYTRFWHMVGRESGQPSPTFAYDIKGMNLSSILNQYFPVEDHVVIVERIHAFEHEMDLPLFDGAVELLDSLRSEGWKLALFTSSDTSKMRRMYDCHPDFRERFDEVVTGDMVSRSKPDPEGYILAARLLGLKPEDCVVVEDSMQGLESGRASGARVVGLTTGNSAEKIFPLCDLVRSDISQLSTDDLSNLFEP